MIEITLSKAFPALRMEANIPYIVEDVNAGQLMQLPDLVTHLRKLEVPRIQDVYQAGPPIVITRPGGIGDLLQLTPLIERLARHGHSVHVCTCRSFWPVIINNPHVDGLHEYPMQAREFAETPNHIWLENAIEGNADAETLHMADVFFKAAGFRVESSFPMHCRVYPSTINPKTQRVSIGLHLSASARNRQYNRGAELIDLILAETDWDIDIYGAPGEIITESDERIHNHSAEGFTLEQTLNHMTSLHGFVGVDSGLLHAAGGLEIPGVALYAAFPGELRCKYHPSIAVIQAQASCAPCFHHQRFSAWPAKCPGAQHNRCVVLDAISPRRILEELKIQI